jgi:hypothetical protein
MSLSGKLEDLGLADIFQILSIGKKTGSLSIKSDKINASVFFRNGLVVRAVTDALESTIGDDLLKAELISEETLKLAREVKKKLTGKCLEEILIDFGSIRLDTIEKISRRRIENVICLLLPVDEGDFSFEPDVINIDQTLYDENGRELSRGLSPEYLLMEGARVYDETVHYGKHLEDELFEDETDKLSIINEEEVSRDFSALKALSHELRFPENPSEISLLILRFASDIFQRGVLFKVEENRLVGLGQFGLEVEAADEKIRETVLLLNLSSYLEQLIHEAKPVRGPLRNDPITEKYIQEIGGGWPHEVAFFPVIVEDRVVLLLYCDNQQTGEPIENAPGLEIFITQAGLAIEKTILKKRLTEREG